MRVFLGFLVAACALAAAVYLNQYPLHQSKYSAYTRKYSWQDPLAIFLAVAGVGAGIAIALPAFRQR